MKHPKYRVKDILFMDKQVREELFTFVLDTCNLLPFANKIKDVELVGSYAFGCAHLGSDMDFNIALNDWNAQVPARRWFYNKTNRPDFDDALMQFYIRTGLKVDIGCVDCESRLYNIVVSLKENKIYNRGISNLPVYGSHWLGHDSDPKCDSSVFDLNTVDLNNPPPISRMHLAFDSYAFRWRVQDRNFQRKSIWDRDEWESVVQEWKDRYGEKYTGYHVEGNQLICDY